MVGGGAGVGGQWRVQRTQTSLPLPRSERSPIDMSARPKGEAERERALPAWILCFSVHRGPQEKEIKAGNFFSQKGNVKACVRLDMIPLRCTA